MGREEKSTSRRWTLQGIKETDPERKMHFFRLALELDPYDIVALNNKGMLHHKKGEFEEAVKCYDRILLTKNLSKPAPVLYNKSLALRSMGKHEAALNFIKATLKHDPEHEKAKAIRDQLQKRGRADKENAAKKSETAPGKLAVNQVYAQWQPPAVSTLLAHSMKRSQREIKYLKGFGEDLIKEKAIRDKLSRHIYCCGTCQFMQKRVCKHQKTKGMAVADTAICRHFRPVKGI
ncbi:tetratricopeptide repeat protein [Methanolobus zinderi]|uniref:Tetratricopeptide repeat protein n=1 Tax=Methanolobus zinderi TaxID=536044 RepID=A0A7D5IPG5_9EURY|nr:tetratricopeptide repeat protein [Methanolobus zinderi]QLC50285.1 tetratricopeptide repeat protein [Methanolobus zinderi]